MSILLLRHGETASNAARIVQTPDAPLSDRGILQSERLAERLAPLGIEAIISSDYVRTVATAEIVGRATGASIELWPRLRERNFGDLRGRAYAELLEDIFAPGFAPPGGETWDEFHTRIAGAWQEIQRRATAVPGHLVVVTHGLVCASIVERRVGLHDQEARPVWANASVTILSAEPPHRVELLACTQHLENLGAGSRPQGGAA